MEEKVLERKIIFEGRLLKFRVDKVELSNGVISTREVVEHRGAVAILPILPDGNIIFVRQFRLPAGKILLEIPAGTLSPNEEPLECAKRELQEETGYIAGKWRRLISLYLAPGYSTECIHIFLAEDLRAGARKPDEDEEIKVCQLSLKEALEMVKKGEVEDAKTVSALLFYNTFIKEG
ncbi:NUDIX hydrolase [bacterium]|nr:NUDIX hydrolase [bacterium]